jgi:hypothetical protein
MHAPRRLPFEPDVPEWPRAATSAPRISLIRFVAMSVPAVAVAGLALGYLTLGADFIDIWREQPVVRYLALGLAVWSATAGACLAAMSHRLQSKSKLATSR